MGQRKFVRKIKIFALSKNKNTWYQNSWDIAKIVH
jgi:hypothetical protein